MTVRDFISEIEKLQSKTTWDVYGWEMCILVRTQDDKWVTAFPLQFDGTDGEGGIYLDSDPRVYMKEDKDGLQETYSQKET